MEPVSKSAVTRREKPAMSLNWKEINLVLEELALPGSFIQKIVQPDFKNLLLSLYHPHAGRNQLLISLEQSASRLHWASRTAPEKKTDKLQRFAQFLRSRIQGGKILEAVQLGQERTIMLKILHNDETLRLYIRLWGGAGNVLVTDDKNSILDALYRRPARGETTGNIFIPPTVNSNPEAAAVPPAKTYTIRERIPGLSFNQQIERQYSVQNHDDQFSRLTDTAEKLFRERLINLETTLAKLEKRWMESEQIEQYRKTADLLSASAHKIKPGSQWLEVVDYASNELTRIALNPAKSVGENIESYYKKYRKAKGAAENLEEEIRSTRRSISQLDNLRTKLFPPPGNAAPPQEAAYQITRLKDFIADSERKKSPQLQPDAKTSSNLSQAPGLQFLSGAFTILVGRSASENDTLLRRYVRGNDYWLHTRDFPGGYVFIKAIKGKSIPLETLLDAGNLALYYSKGRNSGKGELYYTQVKYLRRAKDGPKGLVLPTQEKNLSITLDQKRLDGLFTHPSDRDLPRD
jgi:predicted ribosome quality control (RQC) complex YloA/Tae2 family protein